MIDLYGKAGLSKKAKQVVNFIDKLVKAYEINRRQVPPDVTITQEQRKAIESSIIAQAKKEKREIEIDGLTYKGVLIK